jgi:pimeloyl-ACP methyl ester carboxylesterase
VLFVMGVTGDAGHFDTVADLLADEFTVVTYDRRGNGRSPRPADWDTTSVQEQADDAAALVDALGLSPTAVFGTSSGATYALCLLIRHADAVRGAILHEPPLYSVSEQPDDALAAVTPTVRAAMAAGGPSAALEQFWRWVGGDAGWDRLEPGLRERMLRTSETFFAVERGTYESYRPADATLAAITAPVQVLAGEQTAPFRAEIAGWLARRLGVEMTRAPGAHTPYVDRPRELAHTIRPFLRLVTGAAPYRPGSADHM